MFKKGKRSVRHLFAMGAAPRIRHTYRDGGCGRGRTLAQFGFKNVYHQLIESILQEIALDQIAKDRRTRLDDLAIF